MPGLQQRVRGDEHRQVVQPQVVEDLRETVPAQPLAHHEAVCLEKGELRRAEPGVPITIPGIARLLAHVHDVRIGAKLVPKLRCSGVKRNTGQIIGGEGKGGGELVG